MIEFKGYKCEYCSKLYQSKYHCKNHEETKCTYNPKNWDKCIECAHSVKQEGTYEFECEYSGDTISRSTTTYSCSKLNIEMYPFKAAAKKLPSRFPETFKDKTQMPNECEHFKGKHIGYDVSITDNKPRTISDEDINEIFDF